MDEISNLHTRIKSCRICNSKGIDVASSGITSRGTGRKALIIGIEPGNTELKSSEAFTGLAGKKLFEWLRKANLGDSRDKIFENAYFTSLIKCKSPKNISIKKCYKNCYPFLQEQIKIVNPKILITLGVDPLKVLFNYSGKLDDCVGGSYSEEELRGYKDIAPTLSTRTKIIPLPHPSPLSRWANEKKNLDKLNIALENIEKVI